MALRLGIRQIDGLHREAADRVVARRPYRTVEELRSRGQVPVHAIQRLAAADAFRSIKDGKRVSTAGLVLIRQRPGSAKGVVFITIEDETGIANLVVWPDVFDKQRKIVMGARLMAVHGIVQRDPDSAVIHVVARRVEDHTHMLSHLSDDSRLPSGLEKADHAGSWRPPVSRHPRNVEIIPKSRDFH